MNQDPPIISTETLLAIEESLKEPRFFNMSVGTTLNDRLITKLANGARIWDWKSALKDSVRYYYHRWVPTCTGTCDYSDVPGRLCVTWLFDRFDLKGFVLPVIETYGPERTFVMGPSKAMISQLPPGTEFILWDELPRIDMGEWRREFDRCAPAWRRKLTDVLTQHNISRNVIPYLMDTLQVQTQRIMAFGRFLVFSKPCAIFTEYDRNAHASCLILAAKAFFIPSYTMIHGVLEPYPSFGFIPLLADYVCCWGEQHRARILEYGASLESILVTGCQRLSRKLLADGGQVKVNAGLPVDIPVVMLATSPIHPEYKKKYAEAFCLGVSEIENITAVVRLHPAECLSEYKDLIRHFPSVRFMANNDWTIDESLAATDILVNHDSGFGNDALVKKRLVVILDVLPIPLGYGGELIEMAGCPSAKNSKELRRIIERILVDKSLQRDLHEKGEQYVEKYYYAFGEEATQNIVKFIRQTLEDKNNNMRSGQ